MHVRTYIPAYVIYVAVFDNGYIAAIHLATLPHKFVSLFRILHSQKGLRYLLVGKIRSIHMY